MEKIYTVKVIRNENYFGRKPSIIFHKGTLSELNKKFDFKLHMGLVYSVGGGKEVKMNPKTIEELITYLNNSMENISFLNGEKDVKYEYTE